MKRIEESMTNRPCGKMKRARATRWKQEIRTIRVMAPLVAAAFLRLAVAQTIGVPAFDVASIKSDTSGGNYIDVAPGTLRAHSATLTTCIEWAYGLQRSQVIGANAAVSGMLDLERFTIVAKTDARTSDRQLRIMLQTLLAERFKLAAHRQSRQMQTFALVLDRNGPKFHQSADDGESEQSGSKMTRKWTHTRMVQLADTLSEAVQAPVLDQTGLPARYDFSLDLTPYVSTVGDETGNRPDVRSMMVTAIREQLGLKLESHRDAVDVLVIDHLEKPTAN